MEARVGDPGFVDGIVSLVPHEPGREIATITVREPYRQKSSNMAKWVVPSASRNGVLANADFYKYLEHAEGAILRGDALVRSFTIEDVGRGLWKQGKVTLQTTTVIPAHLRFRLPDNSQGA